MPKKKSNKNNERLLRSFCGNLFNCFNWIFFLKFYFDNNIFEVKVNYGTFKLRIEIFIILPTLNDQFNPSILHFTVCLRKSDYILIRFANI